MNTQLLNKADDLVKKFPSPSNPDRPTGLETKNLDYWSGLVAGWTDEAINDDPPHTLDMINCGTQALCPGGRCARTV